MILHSKRQKRQFKHKKQHEFFIKLVERYALHRMSKSLSSLDYRSDIDGLRAIAISAVVIFHAFPHLLPGGYLGVDIFFVISGYLIASLLEQQLYVQRLNIVHFYQARCLRLVPALCVVLIVNLLLAPFIYSVVEQQELINQTLGAALFFSNFYLENKEGLFSDLNAENPLLHLWSLGVEMQFYVFLATMAWLSHKNLFSFRALCLGIGLASFVYAYWYMGIDEKKTFYSPLARLWEMMLGAVAALVFNKARNSAIHLKMPFLLPCAASVASLAVMYSLFFFTSTQATVVWKNLMPVVAAAVLLIAAPYTFLSRWLSVAPMRWLGRISYSLYLWHWPFIAYITAWQVHLQAAPTLWLKLMALCISVVVAWLSYHYIEVPIRAKRQFLLMFLMWLAIWLVALSLFILLSSTRLYVASNFWFD